MEGDLKLKNVDNESNEDKPIIKGMFGKNAKEIFEGNYKYELVNDVYYYFDEVSQKRYRYDDTNDSWQEVKDTESEQTKSDMKVDKEGRQYYTADGMNFCQDAEGTVHYLDENNEWKLWEGPKEKAAPTQGQNKESHWYFYKGEDTFYRDNITNKIYKLKKETNAWELYDRKHKRKRRGSDIEEFDTDDDLSNDDSLSEGESKVDWTKPPGYKNDPNISYNGQTYLKLDTSDNTIYEWDSNKRAWFPKIDEDFMASYQLSYGFNPDGTKNENPVKYDDEEEEVKKKKTPEKKKDEKIEKKQTGWFDVDDAHNTKVYVTNLPLTITEDEFVDFMQKCGLVLKDVETGKFKVKLYKDEAGNFKGDALCTYIKKESVDLALQILDGYLYESKTVKVEVAKFTLKGAYNPSLKPKKKKKKELDKIQKKQERLFAWAPDPMRGERMKHEYVVIIRNVFEPNEFDGHEERILTHKEAIRGQAETFGTIKKIELFDRHKEGVIKVTFAEVESADMCAATLNKRMYLKRTLTVSTWDGVEKFNIEESEAEKDERLKNWDKFLKGKGD